jgi:hypothetical protein
VPNGSLVVSSQRPTDHNMGLLALAYLLVAAGLGVAALAIAELLDPPPPITATVVAASATPATFVCTPTIAPKLGRDRRNGRIA